MYGSSNAGNVTPLTPRNSAASPAAGETPTVGQKPSLAAMGAAVALLVIAILYLAYAWLQGHERVREAIRPANVRVNVHNLLVIFVAVLITVPLAKVALAKMMVWFPWAQGVLEPLLQLVDAV
jgi:hypothetical protein